MLPASHINTKRIKKKLIILLREFHAAAELFFGGASVGDHVNYPCPLSAISTEDGNLREFDLCGDNDDDDNIDKRNQEQENQVIKIKQIIVRILVLSVLWIRINFFRLDSDPDTGGQQLSPTIKKSNFIILSALCSLWRAEGFCSMDFLYEGLKITQILAVKFHIFCSSERWIQIRNDIKCWIRNRIHIETYGYADL